MGESCHEGQYWDALVRLCMNCQLVCQEQQVISRCISFCVPTALDDSTLLLYSLLALCMVLLFSSLALTLAVFLRGSRARTSNPGPKKATHTQECVIQPGEEVGLPSGQLRQSTKDNIISSRSDDSSPTETCVCVHCFPDLKPLVQDNERLLRAPVLPRAQVQKGGALWTGKSLYTSGMEVQGEAAVR
ncbi:tumor necrosis factor receptor superfamily member 17 isoform X2 [Trachinotus anak]|uniref:tumor necrosis factor receptor superfamily member 17 isoform X2 n=1 Tax=Trachinotus anak TaxID=443729 RepID=UPI0039F2351D